MNTAPISSMNVMCSSIGIPKKEPILKEYFIEYEEKTQSFIVAAELQKSLRSYSPFSGCALCALMSTPQDCPDGSDDVGKNNHVSYDAQKVACERKLEV